jgi:diguanylate cyclase (GGDEF)-like protein/PAS domain S-box-containing protein
MSDDSGVKILPSTLAAYGDLFERLLDPAFLVEPGSQLVLEMNDSAERALGETASARLGRPVSELVETSGRDEFEKALRVAMRRHHPRQFESQWQLAAGGPLRTMEVVACPLRLADSTEILQVIAHDITDRREAEQKIQELLARLQLLSTTDEMTGLCNYRHFKTLITAEHQRAVRYKTSYSVIFTDIDHFKHYNDRNGHPAGDALLREVAGILQRTARKSDVPARYGGEEFVILCPEVDHEGAAALAERIRRRIEMTFFAHSEHQPKGHMSISVGVASYPGDGTAWDVVLKSADEAMYHSKTHGRNQVTTAQSIQADNKKVA